MYSISMMDSAWCLLFFLQPHYGSNDKTPLLADVDLDDDVIIHSPNEKKKEPSLSWAIAKTYGPTMLLAWACKLVYDILTFVGPILQR